MSDGSLIQTGGFNNGDHILRIFKPCTNCDWKEITNGLAFKYKFYPKNINANLHSLPFLTQTNDKGVENNLYPFVFLNVDGNLFVFVNNRAILLDYANNIVVKTFPQIPGGDPRFYPTTKIEAEVLVCGGAPKGSYVQSLKGVCVGALKTCAQIKLINPNPTWVMETMPKARDMGYMILLPNDNVLLINRAGLGTAEPNNQIGSRFKLKKATTIPRMYQVLVDRSNPHSAYNFTGVLFPTELSLEAFNPTYLETNIANLRPKIVLPTNNIVVKHGQNVKVQFTVVESLAQNLFSVTMVAPSFNTHYFSHNQWLLVLSNNRVKSLGTSRYEVMLLCQVQLTMLLPVTIFSLLFIGKSQCRCLGLFELMYSFYLCLVLLFENNC
ncbi:hypothetical protein UlMin_027632 [Ulmus minor]